MMLSSTFDVLRSVSLLTLFCCYAAMDIAAEDSVAPAPDMPDPVFVETNGIRMGVYI